MKETTYETTRFELYENGFYVEVSNPDGVYNFYLCHKQIAHKSYMFCMPPSSTCKDNWKKIIEYTSEIYIKLFWEEITMLEGTEEEGRFWAQFDESMNYMIKNGTKVTENP